MHGFVQELCMTPTKRGVMQSFEEVMAIAGVGLKNDRNSIGAGSWQDGEIGKRQVTLMDTWAFKRSQMRFIQTRRNILVDCHGFDINRLINEGDFPIGEEAWLRVVKYCFPCDIPGTNFPEEFHNNGGVIAEIINGGKIKIGDKLTPPWVIRKRS